REVLVAVRARQIHEDVALGPVGRALHDPGPAVATGLHPKDVPVVGRPRGLAGLLAREHRKPAAVEVEGDGPREVALEPDAPAEASAEAEGALPPVVRHLEIADLGAARELPRPVEHETLLARRQVDPPQLQAALEQDRRAAIGPGRMVPTLDDELLPRPVDVDEHHVPRT